MFLKMRQIVSILTVLCLIVALSACGGNTAEEQILGSWAPNEDDEYMTFYSNGTLTGEGETGTWSITNGEDLNLTIDGETLTVKIIYISSDCMTWEYEGESIDLVKHDK